MTIKNLVNMFKENKLTYRERNSTIFFSVLTGHNMPLWANLFYLTVDPILKHHPGKQMGGNEMANIHLVFVERSNK